MKKIIKSLFVVMLLTFTVSNYAMEEKKSVEESKIEISYDIEVVQLTVVPTVTHYLLDDYKEYNNIIINNYIKYNIVFYDINSKSINENYNIYLIKNNKFKNKSNSKFIKNNYNNSSRKNSRLLR